MQTWVTGCFGVSSTLIGLFLQIACPNFPVWIAQPAVVVGVILLAIATIGWAYNRFAFVSRIPIISAIGRSQSRRIPLIDVRDMAARRGWDFASDSCHCIDLADALMEAGRLGEVRFFGRPVRPGYEHQAHFNALTPIDNTSWAPPLRLVGSNIVDAGNDNAQTKAWDYERLNSGPHYVDLYVARPGFARWLRVEAAKFKGRAMAKG